MTAAYVEACYWDVGYANGDLTCSAFTADTLGQYVEPCYWEIGYAVGDQPCPVSTAEYLMSGLMFDRTIQDAPLTQTRVAAQAVHIRRDTGKMYVVDPETSEIMQWDGDDVNRLPFEWKSKTFIAPKPMNFSFAQVLLDDRENTFAEAVRALIDENEALWGTECSFGDLNSFEPNLYEVNGSCLEPVPTLDSEYTTLYVYADGVLVRSVNVLTEKLYRLPAGFRSTRWTVEVVGNKGVRRITLATSAQEIANA